MTRGAKLTIGNVNPICKKGVKIKYYEIIKGIKTEYVQRRERKKNEGCR
jgi:hypothetical protein